MPSMNKQLWNPQLRKLEECMVRSWQPVHYNCFWNVRLLLWFTVFDSELGAILRTNFHYITWGLVGAETSYQHPFSRNSIVAAMKQWNENKTCNCSSICYCIIHVLCWAQRKVSNLPSSCVASKLQLFIRDNQSGSEKTQINYLGFIGSPLNATNMSEFKRVSISLVYGIAIAGSV